MSASSEVWALVSGLSSGKRERRQLMVLQAFIDDSGSESQSQLFVLAGFISTAEKWAKFSDEWQQALDRPPKLKYFKMREAANLTGEFHRKKGWDEGKRDDRILEFVRIIDRFAQIKVAASVRHDLFEKYLGSLPATLRTLATDKPYNHLAVNLILAAALSAAKQEIFGNEPVGACDFIFDQQKGFEEDFLLYWPGLKSIANLAGPDLKKFIGSTPIFRNDQDFLPLQAADLYAWQVRNQYARNHKVPNQTIHFPPNLVLKQLSSIPAIERHIFEAELVEDNARLTNIGRRLAKMSPLLQWKLPAQDKAEQKRLRATGRKGVKAVFSGKKEGL